MSDARRDWQAGMAAVLLNHGRELQKLGHHVEHWFGDDIFPKPPRSQRFASLLFAIRVARRIMRSPDEFDVVDLHIPSGCVYGAWRAIFGRKGSPPYVFTTQGILKRYVHVTGREQRKRRAWNFGWKNRLWHRIYHQTMHNVAMKTADFGVASNREAWTYPELKYDRDPGRLWYVPNGTEERFFIDRNYRSEGTLRLLFIGSWLDRKGVYYLAQAFRSLTLRRTGIELTVAGCVIPEEEVTRSFAPETRNKVRVVPFVTREDIIKVYAGHDIFVFPSLMEGMPLALLEAMATGMPVVTTETCGMADVIEDDFDGLLIALANTEQLVEAVERLCDSPALRERLGREAQRTMRRYTWQHIAQKLEKVLLLAASKPGDETGDRLKRNSPGR